MSKPRGCFIGNSHLGTLKVAIDEAGHVPFEPSYIYAPGMVLLDLKVIDRKLQPVTDRAADLLGRGWSTREVAIDDHDFFVISGLMLSLRPCSTIYWGYRLVGHEEAGAESGKKVISGGHYLISENAMREAIAGALEDTGAVQLALAIRAVTDKPVFLVPQPLAVFQEVPVLNPGRARNTHQKWAPFRDPEVADRLYGLFVDAMKILSERYDLSFVPQPADTIEGGHSKAIYRGRNAHHMNGLFGMEVLKTLLPRIPHHSGEPRPFPEDRAATAGF